MLVSTYLAALVATSLWIGLVRASWLFRVGTLPDQYHLHGVAWNAAVALGLGLVLLPVVLLAYRSVRRVRSVGAVGFGSLAGLAVCLPFWALAIDLEYGDAATWGAALRTEARLWVPALVAAGLLWALLLARATARSAIRRCAAASAIALAAAGGFSAYAMTIDPSAALPLDLEASAARRPPVFLVLVDTLRPDHLSVYGHPKPTSPRVDALAEDGVVYERAFAQAPWTRPSCGALLSSRFPPEIGLQGMWDPLAPDVPILPQFLGVEGYRTAGIVSSVHLSAQYGFDKGWDLLDVGTTYLRWTGVQRVLKRLGLVRAQEVYPRYNAEELTDRAIAWLGENADPEAPPFMYLHYSDPHTPYWPPPEQDRWREFASEEGRRVAHPPKAPPEDGASYSAAQLDAMLARYDAEVAFFDDHFGRFVDHLRERGLYDDALIIVTSDHGEEFGEHGGWAHGHSLYNELLNVPLIVKYPRGTAPAGERSRDLSGLIDVLPTIRDVIGADWPESGFRGRSLLTPSGSRDGHLVYADNRSPALRGAFYGDHKLVQHLDAEGRVTSERYDDMETNFLERGDGGAPSDPESLRELRGLVAAIYDRMTSAGTIDVDEDTLDELRALGYVE